LILTRQAQSSYKHPEGFDVLLQL